MATFKLSRTKQCSKCPWKVSTNPHEIPNGYCTEKHAALKDTIAEPGEIRFDRKAMACHQSKEGNEQFGEIEIVGKQHKHFKDTLPK